MMEGLQLYTILTNKNTEPSVWDTYFLFGKLHFGQNKRYLLNKHLWEENFEVI